MFACADAWMRIEVGVVERTSMHGARVCGIFHGKVRVAACKHFSISFFFFLFSFFFFLFFFFFFLAGHSAGTPPSKRLSPFRASLPATRRKKFLHPLTSRVHASFRRRDFRAVDLVRRILAIHRGFGLDVSTLRRRILSAFYSSTNSLSRVIRNLKHHDERPIAMMYS